MYNVYGALIRWPKYLCLFWERDRFVPKIAAPVPNRRFYRGETRTDYFGIFTRFRQNIVIGRLLSEQSAYPVSDFVGSYQQRSYMIQLLKHFWVSFGPETSEVKFFFENVYTERFWKTKKQKKKTSKKQNKPLHAGNNENKKKYSRKV